MTKCILDKKAQEKAREFIMDTTAQVLLTKIEGRLRARDKKGARKILVDSLKRMYETGAKTK